MKKTILALAIPAALVATAANAGVTLYQNDTTSIELSGATEVQYAQRADDAVHGEIRVDDADLNVDMQYAINEGLVAFGRMGLEVGKDDVNEVNKSVKTDETYVGLASDFGALSFGRQYLYADNIGLGVDIELKDQGGAGVGTIDTNSNDLIKYGYEGENFFFGASYMANNNTNPGAHGATKGYELNVGYDILDNLNVLAYFADYNDGVKNTEGNGYVVEVRYTIGDLFLGASVGGVNLDTLHTSTQAQDTMSYEIAASYTLGQNTLGLGYALTDGEQEKNEDYKASSIYANAIHRLNDNVRVYAEVSLEDQQIDHKAVVNLDNELGYVVGMEVTF